MYSKFLDEATYKEADLFYSEYVMEEHEFVSVLNLFLSTTSMVFNGLDETLKQQLLPYHFESSHEGQIGFIKRAEEMLLEENILIPLYSTLQRAYFHESIKGATLSNVGLAPFKDLFFYREIEEKQ
jgi:SgrR family transcriptional regulator